MKTTIQLIGKSFARVCAGAALGVLCFGSSVCDGQNTAANLSPGLQEVVKLSQSNMGDDVILAYIKNSGTAYNLSADDVLYLKSQGVSQPVIGALLQTKEAAPAPQPVAPPVSQPVIQPVAQVAPPAPVAQVPPPAPVVPQGAPPPIGEPPAGPEVNFQYFHDQLAPFGTWVEIPGVGPAWHPADAVINMSPGWRPYYDNGQWVHTDNGLFWQSDYTWGDIPFHYGRWVLNPMFGWVWVPDYTWGPAWVFWRHAEADGALGWAPLPFGAVFVGDAFFWNGVRVGADFEFGLGPEAFLFVDGDHFHERFFRMRGHEWRYHMGPERMRNFYNHSVVRNEFHRDAAGRFVNEGIGRERVAAMTHGRMSESKMEERNPTGDREKLAKNQAAAHANAAHGGAEHGGAAERGGAKAPERSASEAGHTAGASTASHGGAERGASTASVSKVYRPPAAASSRSAAPAAASHSAPSAPSSGGKKK